MSFFDRSKKKSIKGLNRSEVTNDSEPMSPSDKVIDLRDKPPAQFDDEWLDSENSTIKKVKQR